MNVVCYERGLLWTWSVMNVVCYERVCYEQVCYEHGLFRVVCLEQVSFERVPSSPTTIKFCEIPPRLLRPVRFTHSLRLFQTIFKWNESTKAGEIRENLQIWKFQRNGEKIGFVIEAVTASAQHKRPRGAPKNAGPVAIAVLATIVNPLLFTHQSGSDFPSSYPTYLTYISIKLLTSSLLIVQLVASTLIALTDRKQFVAWHGGCMASQVTLCHLDWLL